MHWVYSEGEYKISNYYSHIKQKQRKCSTIDHFIDKHANNWKDVLRITGIVKLTNPPRDKEERKLRDIGR